MAERTRLQSFTRGRLPYEASPELYKLDLWLDVWDEILPDKHKYVLGVDRKKVEVRLDLQKQDSMTLLSARI